jgi:hypothetical protein
MDDNDNPPNPYEELGPTRRLTCGSMSNESVPPLEIRELVAEVGLRYRPHSQADLAAHAAQLALLARDLANVDPQALGDAIREHVLFSPFMPKAADLVALIEKRVGGRGYLGGYVSESGYVYRSRDPQSVMREAEKRADWSIYYQAKVDLSRAPN